MEIVKKYIQFVDKYNIQLFEYSVSRWCYWYGGRSSAGRALDCDSDAPK